MLTSPYTLLGLTVGVLSAAVSNTKYADLSLSPTTINPNTVSDPILSVTLYTTSKCSGYNATYAVSANVCYNFGTEVAALKVQQHDSVLRYNSFHVYEKPECGSGPVLQPLNDACSDVAVYSSVKLTV